MRARMRNEPHQPSPGLRTSDIVIVYLGFDLRHSGPCEDTLAPRPTAHMGCGPFGGQSMPGGN